MALASRVKSIKKENNKWQFWLWICTVHCIFRNTTFFVFKIESWKFESEFRETSQDFNSFSSFRKLLFHFFHRLSDWVEILWGFMKSFFKQMLKVSAFYLEKQKGFIPKKIFFKPLSMSKQKSFVTYPIFSEGFGVGYLSLNLTINKVLR